MDIRVQIGEYRSFWYLETQALYHTVACSVGVLQVHTHTHGQVELEGGLPRVSRGRRRELAKEEEGVEEEEEENRGRRIIIVE